MRIKGPLDGSRRALLRRAVALVACAAAFGEAAAAQASAAAPRVEIELATSPGFPSTEQRAWYDLFVALGADDLRIRGGRPGEKAEITERGDGAAKTYHVVGFLTDRGEAVLPGGKFRMRDRARLAEWLKTLREEGPARAQGAPAAPYGLTEEGWRTTIEQLARPVEFSTAGMSLGDALNAAADQLTIPLNGDPQIAARLSDAAPIEGELRGLSVGTALAFILSQEGLAFAPKAGGERAPELFIAAEDDVEGAWPVGREPEESAPRLAPALYRMSDVELRDVSLTQVLEAIAAKAETPLVVDARSLAAAGMSLEKTQVSYPPGQTTYTRLLRRLLFDANMAHEIRVDEAGKPFLWVTARRGAAKRGGE